MSRYFIAGGSWLDEYPLLPDIKVPEHVAVETGLVDRSGKPIMRAPLSCGFHHPRGKL